MQRSSLEKDQSKNKFRNLFVIVDIKMTSQKLKYIFTVMIQEYGKVKINVYIYIYIFR
jgi:hypothetical protein